MRTWITGTLALAAALMAGCQKKEQPAPGTTTVDTGMAGTAPAPSPTAAAQPPDTTGGALWAHLQQAKYENWALWPGKGRFYPGQEPHGALLTTYVNALAQDALTNGSAQMPAGAIIVKENYGPDRTLMAHTVMYKVPGYDPKNHDWFWAKYAPDGKVQMAGRVDMCYQCHQGAAQYDDLWTLTKEKTGKSPPPMKM